MCPASKHHPGIPPVLWVGGLAEPAFMRVYERFALAERPDSAIVRRTKWLL
jgi:hypothetical protein